jgi:hypothetical protein
MEDTDMRTRHFSITTLALFTVAAMIAGCLGQESGIDNRHVLGVAIIPPLDYVEIEAGDESANDLVEGAEFVDYVGYRYALAHGVLSAAGSVVGGEYTGDWDTYQFTSGLEGDIGLDLVWDDEGADFDLYIVDIAGTQIAVANANDGHEHLDYTISEEEELFVQVVGKRMSEGYDGSYTLILKGLDPSEAGDMLIGAYKSGDVDSLGNPVSGTTVVEWNDDVDNYQFWGTFDMYVVQEVLVVESVFLDPELEDFKDNNCDGQTDRGLSDEDHDGDGARISDGDCDDTDDTVRPGWADNFGDGIDGDCDGWADNGIDGSDHDGDGQSMFDGDCNDADASIYDTLLSEDEMSEELGMDLLPDGKDNNCDGEVDNAGGLADDDDSAAQANDWPLDNDADGYTVDDGDCNDADASIRPCADDVICFDYQDGKDNDCDAIRANLQNDTIDENFEYICGERWGTGCSPLKDADEVIWDAAMATDDDGDGYSENFGDCNDTDAMVAPGIYELETYFDVDTDIDKVWLYAGTFASLNTTAVASGDLLMTAPQELVLSEVPDQISWSMDEDWLADGGVLTPTGIPQVLIDSMVPPLFGFTYSDAEPNDCDLDGWGGAWGDCAQDLPGVVSTDGYVDRVLGTFSNIVADTWDGDNDTYHFVLNEDGYLNGELDWDGDGGDMDWYLICYFGDDFNPWNWYSMQGDTQDLTKPETGISVLAMPTGTECYAWLVGYTGTANHGYKFKVWMTPEE